VGSASGKKTVQGKAPAPRGNGWSGSRVESGHRPRVAVGDIATRPGITGLIGVGRAGLTLWPLRRQIATRTRSSFRPHALGNPRAPLSCRPWRGIHRRHRRWRRPHHRAGTALGGTRSADGPRHEQDAERLRHGHGGAALRPRRTDELARTAARDPRHLSLRGGRHLGGHPHQQRGPRQGRSLAPPRTRGVSPRQPETGSRGHEGTDRSRRLCPACRRNPWILRRVLRSRRSPTRRW